jgi:hypothetical protein
VFGAIVPTTLENAAMTEMLNRALAEVRKLSVPEQDAIASLILDELADEHRWQESFAQSQVQLAQLAAQARAEIRAGKVRDVGIDQL